MFTRFGTLSTNLRAARFAATSLLELFFRICFVLYGKDVKVLTKKLAAVCVAPR